MADNANVDPVKASKGSPPALPRQLPLQGQHLISVRHEDSLKLRPETMPARFISPVMQRSLAVLLARCGNGWRELQCDRYGHLIVRSICFGQCTSLWSEQPFTIPAVVTVDLGQVADYIEVTIPTVQEIPIDFSEDNVTFRNKRLMIPMLEAEYGWGKFDLFTRARYVRIDASALASFPFTAYVAGEVFPAP